MFQWTISYVSSNRIEMLCMRACETLEQATPATVCMRGELVFPQAHDKGASGARFRGLGLPRLGAMGGFRFSFFCLRAGGHRPMNPIHRTFGRRHFRKKKAFHFNIGIKYRYRYRKIR
jgi:hypothetical protein